MLGLGLIFSFRKTAERAHVPEARRRGRRRRHASYYGVPPIHKPHWKWLIISYFFLGGLSAGSYVVATVAELFGDRDDRDTVRVGRYLALLASSPARSC